MSVSILVASGITSSLFSSVLSEILSRGAQQQFTFYAPIRPVSDPAKVEVLQQQYRVIFLAPNVVDTIKYDKTLWLSTHVDIDYLTQQSKAMPTLAINSGAILDIITGKQDKATANDYQKAKLDLYNVPSLYNFIPGFFIQDVARLPWASAGLHGETTNKLFAEKCQDDMFEDAWWQKSYCVTPLSILTALIIRWIQNHSEFDKTTIACSERPFRRSDLRQASNAIMKHEGIFELPLLPAVVGQGQITDETVILACRKAYMLQNK